MKVGFIATVFNEEKTIDGFLQSLLAQTKTPDEIVIIDGGSSDTTFSKLKKFKLLYENKHKKVRFEIGIKKGNRSVGRNEAIRRVKSEIIAVSDSGCLLEKNWFEQITSPFKKKNNIDVVAGYYKAKAVTVFQKVITPYVLVMPDKVNPKDFLPATRSMAFTKSIWKKVGRFDMKFSHNEDYVFANKLKEKNALTVFEKKAKVLWLPRSNFASAFIMFFRFAFGDAEAGILRVKVLMLFYRYTLFSYLLCLYVLSKRLPYFYVLISMVFVYILYSIHKNFRYVKDIRAFYLLPLLQLVSDGAVLTGTFFGVVKKVRNLNFLEIIGSNKLVVFIIFVYILAEGLVLQWGIPNSSHPFPYHMDEWHQLQAVRSMFSTGTSNVQGAAHGPILEFFIAGVYLLPFYLLKIINPFAIQSSVGSLELQERLFVILRLNTLLFGVGSIAVLGTIAKCVLKISPTWAVFFFAATPIWISLSNYFKYDIALLFWIHVSMYFAMRFGQSQKTVHFLLAGIGTACAIAVKISALPLFVLYVLGYFIFAKRIQLKILASGLLLSITTCILFGVPDIFYRAGEYYHYLYSNTIAIAYPSQIYTLKLPPLLYYFITQMPTSFGYVTYGAFLISFLLTGAYTVHQLLKKKKVSRGIVYLLVGFILFACSLLSLKLDAGSNRVLVLLPFGALIIAYSLDTLYKKVQPTFKRIAVLLLSILLLVQIFQTFTWVEMRLQPSPQKASSQWIVKNIPEKTMIGIENIPIYQLLPEYIVNDFYQKEYNSMYQRHFEYEIITEQTLKLPAYIVLTNDTIDDAYFVKTSKKSLLKRIKSQKYQLVKQFSPNFSYFKYFGTDFDFYLSGLMASPVTISIYKRDLEKSLD